MQKASPLSSHETSDAVRHQNKLRCVHAPQSDATPIRMQCRDADHVAVVEKLEELGVLPERNRTLTAQKAA